MLAKQNTGRHPKKLHVSQLNIKHFNIYLPRIFIFFRCLVIGRSQKNQLLSNLFIEKVIAKTCMLILVYIRFAPQGQSHPQGIEIEQVKSWSVMPRRVRKRGQDRAPQGKSLMQGAGQERGLDKVLQGQSSLQGLEKGTKIGERGGGICALRALMAYLLLDYYQPSKYLILYSRMWTKLLTFPWTNSPRT